MPRGEGATEIVTIRVSRELARRLNAEARRQRRTRSDVARAALAQGLGQPDVDPLAEARRQSLLVRNKASEREALRFVTDTADLKGWE
jgi:predicted transcriptional regulator